MKRVMLLCGGACWLLFAAGFGVLMVRFGLDGAGLEFFGFGVSSGSALLGLVHVMGFAGAAAVCLAIGVGLCVHGLTQERGADDGT